MKIVIIGNCGCGKTYLAEKLAFQLSSITFQSEIPVCNLDRVIWQPNSDLFRDQLDIITDLNTFINQRDYIIEGVWGREIEYILAHDTVDYLIFIEIPFDECRDNILYRNSNEENGRISLTERLKIVKYASNYYISRTSETILNGRLNNLEMELYKEFNLEYHLDIYNSFNGNKYYLKIKNEINQLILESKLWITE